jgi:hypothetical protein
MMLECYRGGLKSPRIVQDGVNEQTILGLVSTGKVGPCDGTLAVPRICCHLTRDGLEHASDVGARVEEGQRLTLLASFIGGVRRLPDVRAVNRD